MVCIFEGLVTRHQKDLVGVDDAHLAVLGGTVFHHEWKDLQPTEGVLIVPDLPELPYKLRILGGTQSPDWVKDQAGTLPYWEPTAKPDPKWYSCPKWWTDSYINNWANLQGLLRQALNPEVVAQGGGGTRYAEQFIRGIADPRNVQTFGDLGMTLDVDKVALTRLMMATGDAWGQNVDLAVSVFPWQYVEDYKGKSSLSEAFSLIDVNLSDIDLIGAHDIRYPLDDWRRTRYDAMKATGIPTYMQTAQTSKIGDWYKAIEMAIVEYNAVYVELPSGWKTWDVAQLQDLADMFPVSVEPDVLDTSPAFHEPGVSIVDDEPRFDDVPFDHTFWADIEWMAEEGITKGANPPENNLYKPDQFVTRGQMAAFMHRYFKRYDRE